MGRRRIRAVNVAALFQSIQPPALTPAASTTATAREDRAAERDKAKLDEARAALQALKQRPGQAAEERKAMARKKIDQLKARLRMLQMSAAMDPKGAARLAAQLARELGAAVKAYASAGGSTAELGATPAVATPSAGGSEAVGNGAEAGTNAAGAPGTPSDETVSDADEGAASGDQPADSQGQAADPYRKLIDEVNARGLEMTRRNAQGEADREFLNEVKGMANALKAALRQARNKTEDGASPLERQDGDKAIADLEKEIAGADKALNPGVSLLV